MLTKIKNHELQQAFAILFGKNEDFSIDRIDRLKPDEIKTAFRKRALETHPDRSKALGAVESVMNAQFKNVAFAYEILNAALNTSKSDVKLGSIYHHRVRTSPPKSDPTADHFYKGALPNRHLLIGQFLYYCGIISWNTLIKAIVWQKQQRPAIGQIALDWGILSPGDVRQILEERHAEREFNVKFAEYAWQKGYISAFERMALLGRQRKLQSPIGAYFIKQGLLYPNDISIAMDKLRIHNQHAAFLSSKSPA